MSYQKEMTYNLPSIDQILTFFPEIELPVTLADESSLEFSKLNKPLTAEAIYWFSEVLNEENEDGMTEFIPCLQLTTDDDFYTLLYWKGALLRYEYILCTVSKRGKLISKKSIAGTMIKDNIITKSVATIDEDKIIHIMMGANGANDTAYNPDNSQAMTLEILTTGDIIFSLNEELF